MTRRRQEPRPLVLAGFHYVRILLGSAIVALSFNLFLLPNQIAPGGVSGISTIANYALGFEPAYTLWALNIPIFILGLLLLGGFQYGAKTLIGTLFLPLVVFLTKDWVVEVSDPLLGALFGGIGVGLGLGLVFLSNASTGGTDLIAQIVQRFTGLSAGVCVGIIDGLVVVTSAFVFNIELALYALISLFVTTKTIDLVQMGVGYSKIAYIISTQEEEVQKALFQSVDRGVTKLAGYGGYTNKARSVLMCVVNQNEVSRLKQTVKKVDPHAFIVLTNASEVLGEGFKRA
ncbi:YitT family protein [Shouchella patagoniensis]|uniref:YitT family protein n=1 Tax=Shouchella patagoniensis TaxID=228576 RepID=UPI000994EDD5|nr:YitT family protein [Shouchella patagoniensis]